MAVWFTSDTHFGHANIIKYCNRPWSSVDDMNDGMINNWNSVVKPEDEVWHLGDFCMGSTKPKDWIPRLNGNINLVRGNHDKHVCDQGFYSDQDYKELRINKKTFILFHFPLRTWNKNHHGSIHLFGHVHGSMTVNCGRKTLEDCLAMDVGSDCFGWFPVSADDVINIMNNHEKQLMNGIDEIN